MTSHDSHFEQSAADSTHLSKTSRAKLASAHGLADFQQPFENAQQQRQGPGAVVGRTVEQVKDKG